MRADATGLKAVQPASTTFVLVLMVVALVPFSFGFLGVNNLQIREVIIPLMFSLTIADCTVRTRNVGLFLPTNGNLQPAFVLTFMFFVLISYVRNPLMPSSVDGGDGGFKLYYRFALSLMIYFMVIYWANRNQISARRLVDGLLYIALGITLVGLFNLLTGTSIPGLDSHAWSVSRTTGWGSDAGSIRAPFLEVFAQIGLLLILTHPQLSKAQRWGLAGYFFLCIILGGGRVTLISTVAAFVVWLFLNRRYLLTGLTILLAVLSIVSIQLINELAPSPQLARLSKLGSVEDSSPGRHFVFVHLIDEFKANPIIGTGYGKEYDVGLTRRGYRFETPERINKQLRMGSHSTHLQVLKNLGVLGYLPFIGIWLYAVVVLLPAAMNRERIFPREMSFSAQFSIILVASLFIRMIVAGSGSEPRIYIFAAIICCIISEVKGSKLNTPFERETSVSGPSGFKTTAPEVRLAKNSIWTRSASYDGPGNVK